MDITKQFGFLLFLNDESPPSEEEVVLQRGKSHFTRVILDEDSTFPECRRAIDKALLGKVVPGTQRVLLEPKISDSALEHGQIVVRMLILTAQNILVKLLKVISYPVTLKKGTIQGQCSNIYFVVQRTRTNTSVLIKLPQS